ncbi:hypothetical protein RB620_23620 [Paenibacillus sp. LHD-117]|uniref:hypothetical protein n=1 Tax=Paenibacillus sp. LHD-117 TaxID=3071412 RepID=UPI0027E16843|nr:hypothetical protein [Paenibacillus sp. LHD-117]MDQ6422425.1 hypothetical protein [Paenibacillus sp. LHD-117]
MKNNNIEKGKKSLSDHLDTLDKGALIELLVRLSEEYSEVKQALSLLFVEPGSRDAMKQYQKTIRASIKRNADRHGFVPYRNVHDAVGGAEQVMEAAVEALEKGSHLTATEIVFCVLHEMGDLLQTCDDSDGVVGGIITECLDLVHQVSDQAEQFNDKTRSALFQIILKEVIHPNLEGWNEWQLSLLESAALCINSREEKERWTTLLSSMEERERGERYRSSYFFDKAAELRYMVIERFDGEDQAISFIEGNLEIGAIRELAIETAMTQGRYERALELAEEGERQDSRKGLPGLVNQWKKIRCEIYEAIGPPELHRSLVEEFILKGEYEYYEKYKALHANEEWLQIHVTILDKLEVNSERSWKVEDLYKKIILQDKLTDRILKYVRMDKRSIVDYYVYLLDNHKEEVFLLFEQFIRAECANSTNRKAYRKVCGIIGRLIKAGGMEHAKKIVEELQQAYPGRSALLDELQQIKGL